MGSFWSQTTTFVALHRRLFNADNGTCGSCQQTGPFENLQHIGHDISQKRKEQQGAINGGPNSGTIQSSTLVFAGAGSTLESKWTRSRSRSKRIHSTAFPVSTVSLFPQSSNSRYVPNSYHLLITISRNVEQHIAVPTRNVRDVAVVCQRLHNRLGRLNLPEGDERISRLVQRARDSRCRLRFTLCPDNRRLPFLFGLDTWVSGWVIVLGKTVRDAHTFSTTNLARSASATCQD